METWEFEITEVKDPWHFLARRVYGDNKSNDFNAMMIEMTTHLDLMTEHGRPIFKPSIGEISAAQKRDGTWHRVRVEGIDTTDYGKKLKCYLIDAGVNQSINSNRLMKLPSRFQTFPAQVHRCRLWGIHPLMLAFDETDTGLSVQHLPSDKWDVASVKFMNSMIEQSCACKGDVLKKGEDNSLHLRLFLSIESDWMCLNDELVIQKFASHTNEDNGQHSVDNGSFDRDPSTSHTWKTINYSDMPSLSVLSESDSERDERQRQFVQANLKKSLLLSPSKESKQVHNMDSENRGGLLKSQKRCIDISDKPTKPAKQHCDTADNCKESIDNDKVSSTLLDYKNKTLTAHGFARGRASLNPVFSNRRPGGLSVPVLKGASSDLVMKSALFNLSPSSHPDSKSKNDPSSTSRSHQASPRKSPLSLSSPQTSSTPLSLSSSSSAQDNDSQIVLNSTPNQDGVSQVPRFCDESSNSIITSPSLQSFERTGARLKTSSGQIRSGSGDAPVGNKQDSTDESLVLIQPSHRKNLAMKMTPEGDLNKPSSRECLIGKAEGERLLQRLRQKSGLSLVDTESLLPKTTRPGKPQVYPNLGTSVFGKGAPLAMYNVSDIPFVSAVKKVLLDKFNKDMAQGIEAMTWPAILAGRNVLGVNHARLDCEMAYIPPILSLIADRKEYSSLPQKMGPLVLVVVPSWKRARDVYNLVRKFTGGTVYENQTTRTIALYAGGTEECPKTEVSLMRGCEILASTPGSLLRCVSGGMASLKRVCHLVLDSADILTNRFKEEMSSIMQMFAIVVKERRGISVPQQILAFSKEWTDGLEDLQRGYIKHPVLSFSSRVEASVYGEVKQVVTMCRSQNKLSKLSDLIDSLANSGQRVITWTTDIEDAKELAETIKSRGVYCLLTHHGMDSDYHIESIRQGWLHSANSRNGLVVLVATDPCYQDLAITDATTVIHYDMPGSKTLFGNRLACMYEHFSDRLSGLKSEIEPVSHVILTESFCEYAQSYFNVLKRCKSDSLNPSLKNFIQGYITGLQTEETHDFCPFIKSFGFCLDEDHCKNRHILVPERDLKTGETTDDTLPVNGEVKLKVIRVASANRFYCHLLEHRTPDKTRTSLREEFQSLTMEMALFFSKESNHVPYLPPQKFSYLGNTVVQVKRDEVALCGFKTDDGVQRARVVSLKEGTRADPMKQCKVWLVDAGCYQIGTIDQLVKLPRSLAEVPYQAVEVFVCRIKPIDKEAEWTDRADIFVNDLVKDKILIGRIVFRLGMSMWLDPLVHQVLLKKVGLANDLVVRQELLSHNYASPNPEHIQLLCELCRGKVDIPETVMQRYFDYCLEMELTQESLRAGQELYEVNIAAVVSPGLFYIQRWENIEQMDELEAKMCEEMEQRISDKKDQDAEAQLGVGSVGVAKATGIWYRVKIISQPSDDQWEVFLLDYGDRQEVPRDLVRPLPWEYAKLPCQAIECEMANLAPAGADWPSVTVDIMCDLSYYVDREKKKLSVKVHGGKDQSLSLTQRLVVDLYSHQQQVWFAEELVWRCVASWNGEQDDAIKPVLDKPALKNQLFFNPWDKLPYLCANIYWAEKPSEARLLAEELRDLLSQRPERWESILVERQLFPPLVQIIGYLSDAVAHEIVLDSLVNCCLDSPKLCEVAINENLPLSLSLCLEQVSRVEIQMQAVQAVQRLMAIPRFLEVSADLDSILMDMLLWDSQEPLDSKLLDCCCRILCAYMTEDNSRLASFLAAHEDILFAQITNRLSKEGTRDEAKKPWLQLLSSLAAVNQSSVNRKLTKESTIKLYKQLIQTMQNSLCLSYVVLILQSLVESSRKHKMIILESGIRPLLTQMCNRVDSSAEQTLCKKLLSSLSLQFPAQQGLAGRRIEDCPQGQGISAPPVAWTETCFKIQLKVKIKNASVDDFEISANNLRCSALCEGSMFHFDWELYGKVFPVKSRVEPHASHTVISLRKETQGKWGRLLKQKNKPANLSPDFDTLWDSDEEEEVVDENSHCLAKKRKGIFENLEPINAVKLYSSDEGSDQLAVYSNSDDEPRIDMNRVLQQCVGLSKRRNN